MTVDIANWTDEFAIGHEKTDMQHQQLFKLLGLIHKAAASNVNREALIEKSLNTLVEYTQIHFRDEEALMENIGYPLFEPHRKLHDELIQRVENLSEDFYNGEYLLVDELLLFLRDWLCEHILSVDAKVGVYIKDHGLQP